MSKERLMQVLLAPVLSEKANNVAERNNQYTFKVLASANKSEVKAAVELMFEVNVESVQVVNIAGKRKTSRGQAGKRADVRKAYVRLQAGQEIDFALAG